MLQAGKEVDGMKKAILAQKVLASVLAIGLGGFVLPLVVQANSGLSDGPEDVKDTVGDCYVGINGAENNVVIIDSDLPDKSAGIMGGYAESGNASDNSVNISDGEVRVIKGGYAVNGKASDNSVIISGGKVTEYVYGGFSRSGNASDNSVSINGGEVRNIYGGYAINGNATYNSVNISGGGKVTEYIYGGFSEHNEASDNSVIISGGKVTKDVYGGYSGYNASDNSVTISGGTIERNVYGGYSAFRDATDNSVIISGGEVAGDVYGGYAIYGYDKGAIDNSVTISGGTVAGDVYGGRSIYGNATYNSITLSGSADVSQVSLYGGDSMYGNASDNKLIINGWSGTVKSLNNFNGAEGGIEVQALGGREYKVGDEITVITASGGISNISMDITQDAAIGIALTATGTIDIKNNQGNSLVGNDGKISDYTGGEVKVEYTVNNIRASDQTAITTESRAAAAAFVNQGAEAVSDSINSLQGAEAGISTFATVSGNNSKYDTGSYVDINGWNGIVGVAKTKDLNAGKFSYGAFFENGGGNYNTYNDFNGASFRGDGNVVYNGGGLLMRYEQENGVYTEASLRAGTAKNEVSNALSDMDNKLYGFKTENAYYGAHIGIGKIIKLDNGKAWDIYGKYFHTHHEGDSVKIANDVFDFDSVDSDKLRIGARFSEQQGEKLTSYYGLAWEYEFSGDAGGTANHYAMYTPSLEGSTVIGEVGFRYTPGKESPWYFDANVRGYAGMQEGISGSVQAVYSF